MASKFTVDLKQQSGAHVYTETGFTRSDRSFCSHRLLMGSKIYSPQFEQCCKRFLSRRRDIIWKYYFCKSESHPYEWHLSKSVKVSDIKHTEYSVLRWAGKIADDPHTFWDSPCWEAAAVLKNQERWEHIFLAASDLINQRLRYSLD